MIDFELPKELIAQTPASPRDSARLLVYDRRTRTITDSVFSELPKFLPEDTTLVLNNSKVENCRWLFPKLSAPTSLLASGADNTASFSSNSSFLPYDPHVTVADVQLVGSSRQKTEIESSADSLGTKDVEIFVLEKLDTHTIRALVRPGKKFKLGQKSLLNVSGDNYIEVTTLAIDEDGIRTLKLSVQHDDERLKVIEHIPLPPYIAQNDRLAEEYQTIYAKPLGSKAAPTAGLHFTDELLGKIKSDHDVLEVTLHVGLGTFASLTDENYQTGKLHSEWYEIKPEVADKIQSAKHVTTVGTTTTRTLESWAVSGDLMSSTDIFIQPGYSFKTVNSMITNFHLPSTSLLLMIEAFVGSEDELQRIYDHAIAEKYRFYSFGDGMLIL